jgi:hypothetical protein
MWLDVLLQSRKARLQEEVELTKHVGKLAAKEVSKTGRISKAKPRVESAPTMAKQCTIKGTTPSF